MAPDTTDEQCAMLGCTEDASRDQYCPTCAGWVSDYSAENQYIDAVQPDA
jgi:hypothetical protein